MRASSAAPVYYKPFEIKIGGKDRPLLMLRVKEFDDFSEKNIESLKKAARKAASSPEFAAAINTIIKARLERMKDPEPTLFTCAMKEAELKKEEITRQSGVNKP